MLTTEKKWRARFRDIVIDEPTPRELALRAKWSNRSSDEGRKLSSRVEFRRDSIKDAELQWILCGDEQVEVKPDTPDTIRCSFCGNQIDDWSRVTRGKRPFFVFTDEIRTDDDGNVTVERIKLHRQNEVLACPDCCLKIKPAITKEICTRCAGHKVINGITCMKCKGTGKVDGSVRSNNRWTSPEEMLGEMR